ncbi:MAG: hypothetical protein ACI89E_001760, partial [Planctomycetota bacterium]
AGDPGACKSSENLGHLFKDHVHIHEVTRPHRAGHIQVSTALGGPVQAALDRVPLAIGHAIVQMSAPNMGQVTSFLTALFQGERQGLPGRDASHDRAAARGIEPGPLQLKLQAHAHAPQQRRQAGLHESESRRHGIVRAAFDANDGVSPGMQ